MMPKMSIKNPQQKTDLNDLRRVIRRKLDDEKKSIIDGVKKLTPVDTGKMRTSWSVDVERKGETVSLSVTNSAPYSGAVHYKGKPSKLVIDAVIEYTEKEFRRLNNEIATAINNELNSEMEK